MFIRRLLSALLVSLGFFGPSVLSAQDNLLTKTKVFGGYSGYRVGGSVNGVKVPDLTAGWAGQIIFSNGHSTGGGLVVDVNGHANDSAIAYGFALGPRFQVSLRRFIPFADALMGIQHFSPKGFASENKPAFTFGGGMDLKINSRFSVRPIEVSYVNALYTTATSASKSTYFNGTQVQAGLTYRLGLPPQEGAESADCSTNPSSVDTGVPVRVDVTTNGFRPKRILNYIYSSNGGKVTGNTANASIDTTGMEPGGYTVTVNVEDNGKGKHRPAASCEARFTVSAINASARNSSVNKDVVSERAPTLSLSHAPGSLKSGDTLAITAKASSANNHPLTYQCKTSAGTLTGNGPTYTLETAGVVDSTITVDCTVTDDRNQIVSASSSVKIVQPPQAKMFGSIEFRHDARRPTRVDNQAKGELDRYAAALAASPDAKGVVVGYAKDDEAKKSGKQAPGFAALRAVNTKDYLTRGMGIDPARIEPRTGHGEQATELWIVPAEATFTATGTTRVDEAKVKAIPRVAHHGHSKKAIHRRTRKQTKHTSL